MKKKLVLLLVMLLSSLISSFAVEVQIGGLWYDIDTNKKEATVIKYKNGIQYRGNIAIPSSVNYQGVTCRVTSIGSEAFENCSGLTSITIPNSVTSIGAEAFQYCSGLTSISIPNSVTSMNPFAFAVCTGLTSVTIPNSLKSISLGVFCKCSNLQSVTIPNSVEIIGLGAFENCPRLRSVTIPAKAEMVDNRAFDRSTIVRRAGTNPPPTNVDPVQMLNDVMANPQRYLDFSNTNTVPSGAAPVTPSSSGRQICLGCNGTGCIESHRWVPNAAETPDFYCAECGRTRIPGHCHINCPGCHGTGYIGN